MNREVHVRICEGRGVRFPPATRRLVSATRRTTVHCAHHDRDGAAPMVIVVRLVSATRRTTVLYAHHDRDGRPATKGARRTSGRQPVTPTNFRWRPLWRHPDRPDGGDRASRASFIVSDSRGTTCSAQKPIADVSGDRVLGPPLPAATPGQAARHNFVNPLPPLSARRN